MWASANAASGRYISSGIPPELFFVSPASSFHNQHHRQSSGGATINFDSNSTGVGVEVIPLLTATPRLAQPTAAADEGTLHTSFNRSGGGIQLWQQQGHNNPLAGMKKPAILDQPTTLQSGSSSGGNIGGPCSIGATSCQDCGNQAKKDCSYRRCRSCCKSRGYECTTHLKSTWVPAASRRERKPTAAAGSSQSTSAIKKPRLGGGASQTTTTGSPTTTSNTSPPRSFDTSSSNQDASFKDQFPGQVRSPAVFKCVRVTALEDGEDEYAYQAVVRIGGHVFKGFLYDQGRDHGFPVMSELHSGGRTGGRSGGRSGASGLDPTDVVTSSGGGLLGRTSYGFASSGSNTWATTMALILVCGETLLSL